MDGVGRPLAMPLDRAGRSTIRAEPSDGGWDRQGRSPDIVRTGATAPSALPGRARAPEPCWSCRRRWPAGGGTVLAPCDPSARGVEVYLRTSAFGIGQLRGRVHPDPRCCGRSRLEGRPGRSARRAILRSLIPTSPNTTTAAITIPTMIIAGSFRRTGGRKQPPRLRLPSRR